MKRPSIVVLIQDDDFFKLLKNEIGATFRIIRASNSSDLLEKIKESSRLLAAAVIEYSNKDWPVLSDQLHKEKSDLRIFLLDSISSKGHFSPPQSPDFVIGANNALSLAIILKGLYLKSDVT